MSEKSKTPKMKSMVKTIKHVFTSEELAELNNRFGRAYDERISVEADFDAVKAVHKSRITEAESRMTTLRATINAGFQMQDERCVVVLHPETGQKFYYVDRLAEILIKDFPDLKSWPADSAALVEAMTPADFQQELLEAEAAFEKREEILLFKPTENDRGVLVVGRLNGKWFSALRVTIGDQEISERLDSEQPCSKRRFDQIKRALGKLDEWIEDRLGREASKGFKNDIELVKAAHAEREE